MAYLGYEKQLRQQREQARAQRERLESARENLRKRGLEAEGDQALTQPLSCSRCGTSGPAGEMFYDAEGPVCPACFKG